MNKTDAFQLAIKLLDERFALGKQQAHDLIRTSNEVNAVYQCALSLIEDILIVAHPFAEAANNIEKQYGNDLPDHQIQFPEITIGQYRRIRDVITVKKDDLTPPIPKDLLVTLSTTPTWLKPHQHDAAHELKKKGWVIIGFASGDNPPRHARLTLAGIHEKQRCLSIN